MEREACCPRDLSPPVRKDARLLQCGIYKRTKCDGGGYDARAVFQNVQIRSKRVSDLQTAVEFVVVPRGNCSEPQTPSPTALSLNINPILLPEVLSHYRYRVWSTKPAI